jgi:hypothetical protein
MKLISELPPLERAKRYRQLADDARRKATMCIGEIQLSLIKQAGDWNQLAAEAEEEAKAVDQTPH